MAVGLLYSYQRTDPFLTTSSSSLEIGAEEVNGKEKEAQNNYWSLHRTSN
ncbi:hypothetical protein RR46_05246 [Papilio xuthus]|uniref:Uncharacterized protein n=1 Tax=Papilio xuthus TaxID=66420 RepID=A0A194QC25_PAPXU|nr:hypothetical protein RR46_05246 [Papilio xuthus]